MAAKTFEITLPDGDIYTTKSVRPLTHAVVFDNGSDHAAQGMPFRYVVGTYTDETKARKAATADKRISEIVTL